MGTPQYVFSTKEDDQSIYHMINWDRFGTFCDLPLNEQLIYAIDVPEGKNLCLECKAKKVKFLLDNVTQM